MQMPTAAICEVRAFFFWWTRYTTENKHLLRIYPIVNQVKLRPKETVILFVTLGDTVRIFWRVQISQTLQICGICLSRPKTKKKKNEKKAESDHWNKIFSRKVTWWGAAIKFPSWHKLRLSQSSTVHKRLSFVKGLEKYLMRLKLWTTRCSGRIFMSKERTLTQWFLWRRVPAREDPERRYVCRSDCNHEHPWRCSKAVWKHGCFEVIEKFNVYYYILRECLSECCREC